MDYLKFKLTKQSVDGTNGPSDRETDREEEEWLERGDHPLLNDLILETLFGFVRRFDLKACRIICQKWTLHTIPHMRSTFKVKIHRRQNDTSRRIDDFVELFSSNEMGIPFRTFEILEPFRMTDGVGKQFLEICGETATSVDLSGGESDVYMIEDVSELLRATPNIQDLALPSNLISRSGSVVKLFPDSVLTFPSLKRIIFRPDRERKGLQFCGTLIDELLTASPNISDIIVQNITREDETGKDYGIGIGTVLDCIERLKLESSIRFLNLYRARNTEIEQLLRMGEKENGLKLKSLILDTAGITGYDRRVIQIRLATCFKESLEHFCLEQVGNNTLSEFPSNAKQMPKLKSLFFYTYADWGPIPQPVNLNENFPVLEAITFVQWDKNWPELFSKFEPCPTLKSYHVDIQNMKIHTFHDILRVFPNLTKLNVKVHKDGVEILRGIWGQMTQLESLTIHGYFKSKSGQSLDLDSLFTGIPTRTLKRLTDVVNGLDKMTSVERREMILKLRCEQCRLPSIQNLTKLRHLALEVYGGNYWTKEIYLTDITAYLAFYSMNQLKHLDVKRTTFTKTSCELLTKETGLHTWGFQNTKLEDIISQFLLPDREIYYN